MNSKKPNYEEHSQHSAKHLLAVTSDFTNKKNKKEKSEVAVCEKCEDDRCWQDSDGDIHCCKNIPKDKQTDR